MASSSKKRSSKSTRKQPQYDIEFVRQAARGQWAQILSQLAGVDPELLDGKHNECPKCGGTDRFRFTNMKDDGSILCNQCGRTGDGFASLRQLTGKTFGQVLADVAEHLGIEPSEPSANGHARESKDPAAHLKWLDWNEMQVALWCLRKPPITPAAVLAAGGRLARYRDQFTVIALPVWRITPTGMQETCGYSLYNVTGGHLPKYLRNAKTEEVVTEWVKVKLTHGSQPGLIGDLERLRSCETAWKVEGPSDLLAALSLPDVPDDHAFVTNANGCSERPPAWVTDLFAGKVARVLHDADSPGQQGATRWAEALGAANITLPYDVAESHGKDLRDYLVGHPSFIHLQALAAAAAPPTCIAKASPLEAEDDYHRLAKANIDNYAARSGAAIRFWRDEFYTWKPSRGCYRRIGERDFRAKLTAAIKAEFDRVNIEAQRSAAGEEIPEVRKVSTNLVTNVLNATASLTNVPASVELMTWLGKDGSKRQRNLVAMANGLIDVDLLLEDKDASECVLVHTPEWFSTVRLPYGFDSKATCPRWEAFLEKNLEMDPERIKLLQEWAGYLLLPDTGQQKFLVLEGEGANGKSVYCAAISAMLGRENCAHVPLEIFGDRFAKTSTLGKLVNICADVGELDKVAEGYLKSFTSGDVMEFGRKFLESVNCQPSARLMLACNNRPRFSDRSSGIWRRMLLVPWRIQITEGERIANMDKPWWWENSGELPGIFLWALRGLARLRRQGRFTQSELCNEALEDYQDESNPTRSFLKENLERGEGGIKSAHLYKLYRHWSDETGHRSFAERTFGKEVKRLFPHIERKRGGSRSDRFWFYSGIRFSVDEILGEKTHEGELF
jgi:P4 family phage/plasmid primase-like protien